MINCIFKDITEKDMDMLFMEEFIANPKFVDIFLEKINISGATVIRIEHSKVDAEFGESDMTVIIEYDGIRHALLIEDKIDAVAMPNQADRYFKRGNIGVTNNEYDNFDVFIVAPEKYLSENKEAQKYPYKISYERILTYFETLNELRAEFKIQMIKQSIHKQKKGYQMVENKEATAFWNSYIDYQKEHYPHLWLTSTKEPRSITSTWTWYKTAKKDVLIYHKCEKGYMDLTFPNQANRFLDFEKEIVEKLGDLKPLGAFLVKTGKSVALRIEVPIIEIAKPFEEHVLNIDKCFQAAERLNEIVKRL